MYTGLRMPDLFSKVLCQAGAFTYSSRDFAMVDLIRYKHSHEMNIWMDVGQLDFMLKDNRKMHKLLQEKEYKVTYREFVGGHNYVAWRNDLWRGLEKMFPV